MLTSSNNNAETDVIYLDYTMAFGKVDLKIPLKNEALRYWRENWSLYRTITSKYNINRNQWL